MQGAVFLELLDMAAARFGAGAIDRALELADLESGGDYEEKGEYDPRELSRLIGALAKRTGLPAADLMRAFGRHLFLRVAKRQGNLADGSATERWARLTAMLPHDGPSPPKHSTGLPLLEHRQVDGGRLEIRYEVTRVLADLVDGFVAAASERLGPVTEKEVSGDAAVVRGRLLVG